VPIAPASSGTGGVGGWQRAESAATSEMARRLVELGHRRVTFLAPPQPKGPHGAAYRRGRLGALSAVLRAVGAELTVAGVDPRLGFDECRAEFGRVLAASSSTALVCGDHLLAPPLLAALAKASRRPPDDLSLVVYGDSDWARAYLPPLSVIGADTYTLGQALATALLDGIAGLPPAPRDDVSIRYVERGSCGPAPRR
jgi:DNA-binding LacI/PurR family transcriptional regulator